MPELPRSVRQVSTSGQKFNLPPIRDILGAHLSPSSSPKVAANKVLSPSIPTSRHEHASSSVPSSSRVVVPQIDNERLSFPSNANSSKLTSQRNIHTGITNGSSTLGGRNAGISSATVSVVRSGTHTNPTPVDTEVFGRCEYRHERGQDSLLDQDAGSDISGVSQYQCPYCLKLFTRPSGLKIHINVHTGDKPFQCPHPGCGRCFSVQSNMRRHMRIHVQDLQRQQDDAGYGEQAEVLLTPVPAYVSPPSP